MVSSAKYWYPTHYPLADEFHFSVCLNMDLCFFFIIGKSINYDLCATCMQRVNYFGRECSISIRNDSIWIFKELKLREKKKFVVILSVVGEMKRTKARSSFQLHVLLLCKFSAAIYLRLFSLFIKDYFLFMFLFL